MKNSLSINLSPFQGGDAQSAHGLRIVPIFRESPSQHAYLSLHEALAQGTLVITEVSAGGSVPELKVINRGKLPVFLLDGEELRGAKQNRVLNTSVLIAGESELIIPVSCTEAGRWHEMSAHFEESHNVMSPSVKANKVETVNFSLHRDGSFRSDQSSVWQRINEMHERHGTHSRTAAMSDVYEAHRNALDQMLPSFSLLDGQCGIFASIGGQFAGIDLVSLPEVWKDLHDKIIRSYVLDAMGRNHSQHRHDPPGLKEVFSQLADCAVSDFKGVGLGTDLRLDSPGLVGSALIWNDELAHLGAYPRLQTTMQNDRYHSPRHRH